MQIKQKISYKGKSKIKCPFCEDGVMEAVEYINCGSPVAVFGRFECDNCVYTLPFGFENYLPQLNHLIVRHAKSG